ncbi:hypothetical protein CPC08DRAFT_649948, partial [Agrocybe pediades]
DGIADNIADTLPLASGLDGYPKGELAHEYVFSSVCRTSLNLTYLFLISSFFFFPR